MKVYVLVRTKYEFEAIEGVFSDIEKAKKEEIL